MTSAVRMPPSATPFKPLKNENVLQVRDQGGSVKGARSQGCNVSDSRRICRLSLIKRIQRLNHAVRVTNQRAGLIDLGGSRVVVVVRVDEVTGLEVPNLHLDSESSVGSDGAKVGREDEDRGWQFIGGEDATHRNRVAASGLDLLTIGDGNVLSQAEVHAKAGNPKRVG